jgi:hypothetical protein
MIALSSPLATVLEREGLLQWAGIAAALAELRRQGQGQEGQWAARRVVARLDAPGLRAAAWREDARAQFGMIEDDRSDSVLTAPVLSAASLS